MLHFPEYKEIPLENPPIAEVICQVRFPPILRIANQQPAEFQDKVRKRFPNLEFGQELLIQMNPLSHAPPDTASGPRLYHFKTEDGAYNATLAPDFFSLSTKAYSHWIDFSEYLSFLTSAMLEVYDISKSTRIGLRYFNQFTLENTGVSKAKQLWEYLRPELRSHWCTDAWEEPIETLSHLVLSNGPNERLAIRFGYSSVDNVRSLLDLDYFVEDRLDLNAQTLIQQCERYHHIIYNAFRWAVPEEKLTSFNPISDAERI